EDRALVPQHLSPCPAAVRFPQPGRAVLAAGEDRLPVRTEGHDAYGGVGKGPNETAAAGRLPQPGDTRRDEKPPAVRAEGYLASLVPDRRAERPAGGGIPQARHVVGSAGQDRPAVRTEGDREHVGGLGEDQLARAHLLRPGGQG